MIPRKICVASFALGMALATFAGNEVNVTQYHNHYTRDGLYIDPAFTLSAVANVTRDTNFDGTIPTNWVEAQLLYVEGGPDGRAKLIVTVSPPTTVSYLMALDAATGKPIWSDQLAPTALAGISSSVGIRSTPAVDLPSRTLFCDAVTPIGHMIFGIDVDTGATNAGWPINVESNAIFGTNTFSSRFQAQRGALAVLGDYVYVPYGSYQDQGNYHGWLVGVQISNPTNVTAWATDANRGGAWAISGVASDDGVTPCMVTGNADSTTTNWSGGQAVIRFQPGPIFSGASQDYWAPTNWWALEHIDRDICFSGVAMVDAPGATPSQLAIIFAKDGYCYLLNRTNLGGISLPLAQVPVRIAATAPATYHTSDGRTFVAMNDGQILTGYTIGASNPPSLNVAWTNPILGVYFGSPFVTTTDGSNNPVVWLVHTNLCAFDGLTGAQLYCSPDVLPNPYDHTSGIVARGRIYAAARNGKVYAFTVPVPPIVITNLAMLPGATFQFSFTNTPGLSFTVFSSTNLSLPTFNWTRLGHASEISPGSFEFTDLQETGDQARYYRVASP